MKDVLKLALEALERYQVKRQDFDTFEEAITSIKEALAPTSTQCEVQPEQESVAFAGIKMWVGNDRVTRYFTRTELHRAQEPWMHIQRNAELCIDELKEKDT